MSKVGKPPVIDGLFKDPAYSDARTPVTECVLCGDRVANYYTQRFRHGNTHVADGEAVAYKDVIGRTLFFPSNP